jgi:hypothetical protein
MQAPPSKCLDVNVYTFLISFMHAAFAANLYSLIDVTIFREDTNYSVCLQPNLAPSLQQPQTVFNLQCEIPRIHRDLGLGAKQALTYIEAEERTRAGHSTPQLARMFTVEFWEMFCVR